jgi:hypothetical protein
MSNAPCAGHEQVAGFEAREKSMAPKEVEEVFFSRAESRPKRRKTSEIVTTMEIRMRTMMIQV